MKYLHVLKKATAVLTAAALLFAAAPLSVSADEMQNVGAESQILDGEKENGIQTLDGESVSGTSGQEENPEVQMPVQDGSETGSAADLEEQQDNIDQGTENPEENGNSEVQIPGVSNGQDASETDNSDIGENQVNQISPPEQDSQIQDTAENREEPGVQEEAETEEPEKEKKEESVQKEPKLKYRAHVQDYGWLDWIGDGGQAGTTKESKRLEAVEICISDTDLSGSVEYRTHVQDYGWLGWTADGSLGGTTGEKKRLEAIEIRLTGELSQKYDIYYRVHVQNFGWLGWAKNGEDAGSQAYGYRLEALEICLVEKGETAPGSTGDSFRYPKIQYKAHVENIGWQAWSTDGEQTGTTGQKKQMEAIEIRLPVQQYSGSVEYRAHVQNIGWQGWVSGGALSGTTGQKKQMEAVEIRLTGEMAQHYDIYYRAHVQQFGWLGWAKNGEKAGSESYSLQMEALEIRLVEKGASAPGAVGDSYRCPPSIQYQVHAQDYGWMSWVTSSTSTGTAGTTGQSKRLEAVRIQIPDQQYSGEIQYRSHVQDIGWQDWVSNGELSGTTGERRRLEAIQIRLTGELAEHYDIYYRTHVQSYGWLGWAKNGASAGTVKHGYRMEAIQIRLMHKGAPAPGSVSGAFKDGKNGWFYEGGYKFYYKNNVKQTDIRSLIGRQSSYLVKVNKAQSCVTVYAKDGNNGYIIPIVAFACSPGSATPTGTFHTGVKHRWHYLFGGRGQWTTQITGDILFHSVPYTDFNNRTMFKGEYNKLGTWASAGCVRLRAADAKWIYDYCRAGTQVTIYNSSDPGPLGKPVYAKIPYDQTWDPTDPYL